MVSIRERCKSISLHSLFLIILAVCSCSSVFDELENNMVNIPAGKFPMGSEALGADPDEYPVHTVKVESFRLCRFEVSQRLWIAVMGSNPSYHKKKNHPVEMVSYPDAERFINRLNKLTGKEYRLPSEAEWEYAAYLGKNGVVQPLEDYAWISTNANGLSHPIGERLPDALTLYDMIGNVNEWVSGTYDGKNYSDEVVITVDSLEIEAVFRGGGFNSETKFCRISNRNHVLAKIRNYAIGLRLAE